MENKILQGDCLVRLKELEDNSIDSIVTDPPYELGFLGKSWDNTGIANDKNMWAECLRVLKPGGYLLSFSATRTYHRMASAIEDAGFEVRNQLCWAFGSGFPKSLNIGRALLKDIERELKKQGIENITWK
jgi:DNA modification methylase